MRTLVHLLGGACGVTVFGVAVPAVGMPSDAPTFVDAMKLPVALPAQPEAPFTDSDGGNFRGRIPYNGGPVIENVRVVAVFWGNHVDPAVVSSVGGFYSALTHGSFMHFVSEYSTITQTIGAYGSLAGTLTIAPINGAASMSDADIQAELTQQIALGALPPADANTVYMVHFPPGLTITGPGTTGVSCVDYCGYHYAGSGLVYAVLPDQSGGCAPGPPGCNTSTTARCCGDKTPLEDLTKTASHELMEAMTDPLPSNLAWQDVLGGFGEIADPCNFSRIGSDAFTSVLDPNGRTYQAQKGFSDAAYLAGLGTPRGCVGFPTTLCCDAPALVGGADPSPPTACSWLPSGARSCLRQAGDVTLGISTLGGFGSATLSLGRSSPFFGVCFPLGASSQAPDYCATVVASDSSEQRPAEVTLPVDGRHQDAEACYGVVDADGGCPSETSNVLGSCCGPLIAFVPSGVAQVARTTIPGFATVPAMPRRAIALFAGVLLGLGGLSGARRRPLGQTTKS